MSSARYLIGDVREVLASLEPGSVDLVMTSPPFLALRSYLPADHPDKRLEIGSEPTPGEFIDTLLDVVEACERVLAPHGSMCIELGDTYSGSGGAGGDYGDEGWRAGQLTFRQQQKVAPKDSSGPLLRDRRNVAHTGNKNRDKRPGWPLDKSLCLIPEIFRLSLVYGFNPLTGRQTPRWRARNVIRWCRPNPPVGALGDKFRPATSEMVVICKSRTRYFDLDAVRTDPELVKDQRHRTTNGPKNHAAPSEVLTANYTQRVPSNPAGAPPLDWWKISTQPYDGAHYATYPEELCIIPVKAMCPLKVCRACGEPSRRIVDVERLTEADDSTRRAKAADYRLNGHDHPPETGWQMQHRTIGWSDCGHNAWRTGVVLDPFSGSGTTLQVATGHGRDAIGIDLDERNADLALHRVGPLLLTVERARGVAA